MLLSVICASLVTCFSLSLPKQLLKTKSSKVTQSRRSGLINSKSRLINCHGDELRLSPRFAQHRAETDGGVRFVEEMEVTRATIGSDAWKNASIRNIRLTQTVLNRSDKACELGQQLDPLPSLRDTSIQQSNARIHAYCRATRAVLVKLRESLLDTNEEIKSLLRGKGDLEKTLEHIRKDIILNTRSTMQRQTRPPREKVTLSVEIFYVLLM